MAMAKERRALSSGLMTTPLERETTLQPFLKLPTRSIIIRLRRTREVDPKH
jgi:hypothetical protein